jgi:hypothetical protein
MKKKSLNSDSQQFHQYQQKRGAQHMALKIWLRIDTDFFFFFFHLVSQMAAPITNISLDFTSPRKLET